MKVLHICNNFIGSTVHQKMVQASRQRGIQNVVFAPVVTMKGRVMPGEDEHAVVCVNKWDRFFFYHKQEKTYRALRKTLPHMQFDLVHAHCMFTDGNVALRIKREYGIPYLVTVNNTDINHFFRLRILLRSRGIEILREAAGIVFISDAYRKQLFDKYIPAEYREALMQKTHVIPFGVDDFWLSNLCQTKGEELQNKELRLVYAGDVCRNKNLETTLRAMGELKARGWNVSLSVAGNVVSQRLYKKITSDPAVTYVGILPKENLLELYRTSNIFVMPSFHETFGLVYAEALSQGLPVVYSRGQGFDTQLPEGTVGFHVDPYDHRTVASALEQIAEDYPAFRRRSIESVARFDWNAVATQYQSLYCRVAPGADKAATARRIDE